MRSSKEKLFLPREIISVVAGMNIPSSPLSIPPFPKEGEGEAFPRCPSKSLFSHPRGFRGGAIFRAKSSQNGGVDRSEITNTILS